MSRTSRRVGQHVLLVTAALALAVGLAATGVRPASAELEHPRQSWLRSAHIGLFLHWGMFTAPVHTDCAAWEQAVTGGGWTPDYWVDQAQKLHASYLVLATFHSRLGYARPWPSAIPGSCSTRRDILGELVAAAKAKGLKVVLYMTDDPQWHDEKGVETLDSAAYSAYKGHAVDLTTRDGFGEYSYDLFFEVMRDYPDLAGFWIDNDNAYWERNHLYEQIRALRPSWTLSNNNEDTPIMDMVSHEQKTGMTPAYDYPQAIWTPMPRLTEGEWKLPTGGSWWYDGQDREVDYPLNVGRIIANAGSSVKSLIDETAMVDGRLPAKQEAFNTFADGYLEEIWESIGGTEGGGYMYGGPQPGDWNDGAHGFVTVRKDDPDLQYVHVTTPPATADLLRIRDNGYQVRHVRNLRTGAALHFHQAAGFLTISGISGIAGWDTYDTVLEVQTRGRHFFYPHGSIDATASSSAEGFPASNLTDGSYLRYWDANRTVPVSIDLDLGAPKPAAQLAVHQREWSPTHNRQTFGRAEDSTRIRDFQVYASDDGRNWGAPVVTGTLPSARGVQFIDLPPTRARHLRLEILSAWGSPDVPAFYHKVAIDELEVAYASPRNGAASGG